MGGGDEDSVRRVERARREFDRLSIQQQGTTQQFHSSFMDPQPMPQQFDPFFMEPHATPHQFNFNHPVFQPQDTTQLMTQQATLFARSVYVDGLPPSANKQKIAELFNILGGNSVGPGDAVCSVCLNHEQRFALVEFRMAEEASNALALDGILFEGMPVRVRRPADYNPFLATALGPSQPSCKLNLAAVGQTPGSAGGGLEDPDLIFVGGLPNCSEDKVRQLLESFGPLREFELVKDRETGNSKGYAFCVYSDTNVTDIFCDALNGTQIRDKILTVRRANQRASLPRPEPESMLLKAQQQVQMQKLANPVRAAPTKVVCLVQVVSTDELKDDEEYDDIMDDMWQEASRYGNLVKAVIPRPDPSGHPVTGVGKVFLEYSDAYGATRAKMALHGRKFDGKPALASYYPELKFADLDFDG